MRTARVLICALVVCGALAAGVLVPRAVRSLHALTVPRLTPRPTTAVVHRTVPQSRPAPRARQKRGVGDPPDPQSQATGRATDPGQPGSHALFVRVGLELAGCLLLIGGAVLVLAGRRARRRLTRTYALYELHLSTHDQAKGQDLEDMVESIANLVRAWPGDRARNGQPYVALELICDAVPGATDRVETEWSINVRCEPRTVTALDGAISAAYPDTRIGHRHGEHPRPRSGVLRQPRYVMRFRKERSFVYSLIADGDMEASSPLEQIARAQVAQAAPSLVRFQLIPTPTYFEELARRLYRRHESKLVRAERWGLPEGGLWSTFNRAEMRAAERTQNRSLFWLETVVAADSREVCKAVAAAVQSRRGENRLHRRWMLVRQSLYRRRFPRALSPLMPSFRSLVSAAEVAHLLALPSARMKGVPVRRVHDPADPGAARGRSRQPAPADRTDGVSTGNGGRAVGDPRRRSRNMTALGVHRQRDGTQRPNDLYPMLRAENAEVLIHPDDRKYGALLVGGQGSGKTSALLTFYLNDIEDPDAAPIVIDPKSELSRICLRVTPPDCGKRVWFLDLGRPAFGMSPLRPIGDRPPAIEAAQIAENVVAALLDINENQIYQSSRRYLYHAVIGAIAIAEQARATRSARGRLHAPPPRQGGVPECRGRGLRRPARPRPDRRVLPLRAAR